MNILNSGYFCCRQHKNRTKANACVVKNVEFLHSFLFSSKVYGILVVLLTPQYIGVNDAVSTWYQVSLFDRNVPTPVTRVYKKRQGRLQNSIALAVYLLHMDQYHSQPDHTEDDKQGLIWR